MGAEILIPLAVSAISGGMTAYNTNRTAKKQDAALATQIRNQSAKQRQADARVNAEVDTLKQSTAGQARTKRMADYTQALRRGRAGAVNGLDAPLVGGADFLADSAQAAGQVDATGAQTADWMARIDAPTLQRQGEGNSMGRMGDDIGILSREAKGQCYLDERRLRAIRRKPWSDLGAGLVSAAGGAFAGRGADASGSFGPFASGYRYPTASGFPTVQMPYGVRLPQYGG